MTQVIDNTSAKSIVRHSRKKTLHLNSKRKEREAIQVKSEVVSANLVSDKFKIRADAKVVGKAFENMVKTTDQALRETADRYAIVNPKYKKLHKERNSLIAILKDADQEVIMGESAMIVRKISDPVLSLNQERLEMDMASAYQYFLTLQAKYPKVARELFDAHGGPIYNKAFTIEAYKDRGTPRQEFVVVDRPEGS